MIVFKKISSILLLILIQFYIIVSCSVLHNPEMLKEYQLFLNRKPRPFTYALKKEIDLYPENDQSTYATLPVTNIYKNDKPVQFPLNTKNALSTSNVLLDNHTNLSSVQPLYGQLPVAGIVITNPALSLAVSRNQDNTEHVSARNVESPRTDAIGIINDGQSLKKSSKSLSRQKVLQRPLAFSYYDNEQQEERKDGYVSGTEIDHQESTIGASNTNDKEIQSQIIKDGQDKIQYASHKSTTGEKKNNGYKEYDEYAKQEKGHHNHKQHEGNYDDNGEKKEAQFHEHDYRYEHHKNNIGKKEEKFEEDGEHGKGHSTKGSHITSKKDHFEKKYEFFDEFYEDDEDEKDGVIYIENDNYKGDKKKGNYHQSAKHENKYGKKGFSEKGTQNDEDKGHKKKNSHGVYYANKHKYREADGKDGGKEWAYHHGNKHNPHKNKLQSGGIQNRNLNEDKLENHTISNEATSNKETDNNLDEEIKDEQQNQRSAEEISHNNNENIDNNYKVYENPNKYYDIKENDHVNQNSKILENYRNDGKNLDYIDEQSSSESDNDKIILTDYIVTEDLAPKKR